MNSRVSRDSQESPLCSTNVLDTPHTCQNLLFESSCSTAHYRTLASPDCLAGSSYLQNANILNIKLHYQLSIQILPPRY